MNLKTLFKVPVVAVGLLLICSNNASAAFVLENWTDNARQLNAEWRWDVSALTQSTTKMDNLWQSNITVGPKVNQSGWVISWGFDHLLGPDANDKNPAPFFSTADFAFNQRGLVVDRNGSWIHPTIGGGSHGDIWSFQFVLSDDLKSGDAILKVDHVPIPAAVWLLGSGLIGLVGIGRRKFFREV